MRARRGRCRRRREWKNDAMPDLIAEFTTYGEAKTAGSKKGFVNPKTGAVIITDDVGKAGKTWRGLVQQAALMALGGEPCAFEGAVLMDITFYRARPKGHFGAGSNARIVKGGAPAHPITRPDADKLSRAILDALKGIVWKDDAQVIEKAVRKRYAATDFVVVKIFRADEQLAADLSIEGRVAPDGAAAQGSLLAAG